MQDKLKLIDEIPNVNCGGCGEVAKRLYYHLLQNKHPYKKLQIYYILHNRDTQGILATRNGIPNAPTHVVIKYGKDFMDSHGIMDKPTLRWWFGETYQLHPVTIEFLEESLTKPRNSWNQKYDRKNNRVISKILPHKKTLLQRLKGLLP